jgi:hypothetical protein
MYGMFTGLCLSSNIIGAVIWTAMILSRSALFRGVRFFPDFLTKLPEISDLMRDAARWQTVVILLTPFELLFVSISQLLVLFRLLDFAAALNVDASATRRFQMARKAAVWILVIGNAIGLVGGGIATAHYLEIPVHLKDAQEKFAIPDFFGALGSFERAVKSFDEGNKRLALEEMSEAVVLMTMLTMFAAAGVLCARSISIVMRSSLHPAQRLRQRIFYTVAIIFLTSVLRTAYAIFVAITNQGQNISASFDHELCDFTKLCDAQCFKRCARSPTFLDTIIAVIVFQGGLDAALGHFYTST